MFFVIVNACLTALLSMAEDVVLAYKSLCVERHPLDHHFMYGGGSGVPAMHAALIPPNGNVLFLDKVENCTLLTLSSGRYAASFLWNPDLAPNFELQDVCLSGY